MHKLDRYAEALVAIMGTKFFRTFEEGEHTKGSDNYFNRLVIMNDYRSSSNDVVYAAMGESRTPNFRNLRTPQTKEHKQYFFDLRSHQGVVSLHQLSDALWYHFNGSVMDKKDRVTLPKLGTP